VTVEGFVAERAEALFGRRRASTSPRVVTPLRRRHAFVMGAGETRSAARWVQGTEQRFERARVSGRGHFLLSSRGRSTAPAPLGGWAAFGVGPSLPPRAPRCPRALEGASGLFSAGD